MINFFYNLDPIIQTLIASIIAFLMTTLGSLTVFAFKNVNKNIMDGLLGISAGIMLSAAIFSLLLPAIEQANNLNMPTSLIISLSILLGALLLIWGDKFSNSFNKSTDDPKKNIFILIVSIILHNIPEGMAIGVAFGSIIYNLEGANVAAAISLSLGIAIQNLPEGAAISIPLRRVGLSRFKSFLIGALSGIVEPISAIIGAILVLKVKLILPFLLAFASGAMIFVIVEELIPESQTNKHKNIISYLTLIGFVCMMLLEINS